MKKILLIIILLILFFELVYSQNENKQNNFNVSFFISNSIAETFARGGYGRLGFSSMAEYSVFKYFSFIVYQANALYNFPLFFNAKGRFYAINKGLKINYDRTSIILTGLGMQFWLLGGYKSIYYAAGMAYRDYSITVVNQEYDIYSTYKAYNSYKTHGIILGGRNSITKKIDFTMHYYHSLNNIMDSFLNAGLVFKF